MALTISARAQEQRAIAAAPPTPYIDKGACPFECCTYRQWIAREKISLLDKPKGKTVVARLQKGEKVQAITGEVHSIPLRVVAEHDHPEAGVKPGDIIYILHYEGECNWKAWRNGQIVHVANCSDEGPVPRVTWWVQLKTKAGVVGWAVSHRNFDNQDACGS